jgi:hypothetical protein
VPEVYWDGAWHMLDASLINYFPKADGTIAGVEEIMGAVKEWYDANPGYKGEPSKLMAFQQAAGWTGWRKGPALLAQSPLLDQLGLVAGTHARLIRHHAGRRRQLRQQRQAFSLSGAHNVELSEHVLRRYDYRLKFELLGEGSGLAALRIVHDIQHSQRPLPALAVGDNTITFSAGPPEGTVTIEGATKLAHKTKQLVYTDFHPAIDGFEPNLFIGRSGTGSITFPMHTPGDLVRLRFGAHYRVRDARDGIDYQESFDAGKTWRTVDRASGATAGDCRYTAVNEVPAGVRAALVRYAGTSRNATGLFNFRIDADYREPHGGFRPVRVTYAWDEAGQPREHVHVAHTPTESYTIACRRPPLMKSIVLELAP